MKKFVQLSGALVTLGAVLFFGIRISAAEAPKPQSKAKLADQVEKIFTQSCATTGCHQGAYPKRKLNLEPGQFIKALVDKPSLQAADARLVDTANPEKSYLLVKVRGDSGMVESLMPIQAPPLKAEQIKILEDWVHSLHKPAEKVEKALPGVPSKEN